MATIYRERISDERLEAVAEVVHRWLIGDEVENSNPDVLSLAKVFG